MLVAQEGIGVGRDLVQRMSEARRCSDDLFRLVRPAFLYERPIPERHRIIFYIGHLEAFDWNLLHARALGLKAFDSEFDRLFAFGIDPVSGGLPSDQPSEWPTIEMLENYRTTVRHTLDQALADHLRDGEEATAEQVSLASLLNVAIEHRLMHVETLAYMLHQLPLVAKIPQTDSSAPPTHPINPRMIEIPAGPATLGLERGTGGFGWDNEFDAHTVEVSAFAIDQYKVTNAQFLDFIAEGGYEERSLWTGENWDWKNVNGISHPVFWFKTKSGWLYRSMFEEIPLPSDWPVYVSHAEASAYARWAGKLLPSEARWHRAAFGTADGRERTFPWGNKAPSSTFGNFDLQRWNPVPVNAFEPGRSAFGVDDMLGNGWEWTSTVFSPFDGFKPFPFYPRYSADFFDGRHFVMKGGSARTAACMLRRSFRNWFQAHYQYVYAGFRCVSC